MSRKSQITMFILVGLIFLLLLGLFIYIRPEELKPNNEVSGRVAQPVKEYLEACADDAASSAVRVVSRQGGVYIPGPGSAELDGIRVEHYYDDGLNIPSNESVNKALADAASSLFLACMDGYSSEESGYSIEIRDPKTIAYASLLGVRFRFDYDAVVTGASSEQVIRRDEVMVPVEFTRAYTVASKFASEQSHDRRTVRLPYLMELCSDAGLEFEMFQMGDHIVFKLFTKDPLREQYVFAFSFRYGEERLYGQYQEIRETPLLFAKVGREFRYNLEYSDAYAYTEIFNATHGEIRFTPKPEDAGLHDILIIANTTKGWEKLNMNLNISEGP